MPLLQMGRGGGGGGGSCLQMREEGGGGCLEAPEYTGEAHVSSKKF